MHCFHRETHWFQQKTNYTKGALLAQYNKLSTIKLCTGAAGSKLTFEDKAVLIGSSWWYQFMMRLIMMMMIPVWGQRRITYMTVFQINKLSEYQRKRGMQCWFFRRTGPLWSNDALLNHWVSGDASGQYHWWHHKLNWNAENEEQRYHSSTSQSSSKKFSKTCKQIQQSIWDL